MAVPHSEPWTYELYSLLPEDGRRHEILAGEHYVTPAPSTRHQRIVHRLAVELELALRGGSAGGEILSAPCDVRLSNTDVVQPDVLFVSKSRRHIVSKSRIEGSPDLVIEVLSEGTRKRDEILKRKLYERFGVQEYWVVDPELETVKIYRQEAAGAFGEPSVVGSASGDSLATPLLPGLSAALQAIFR